MVALMTSFAATPPYDDTPRLPPAEQPGSVLERYYPARARDQGLEGRAVIQCAITDEARLTDCVIISETPAGAGFGQASIRAASKFRMRPKPGSGTAQAGQRVTIPINWTLADPPSSPVPLPIPTGE